MRELRVEPRWRDWTSAARADYEEWQQPTQTPGTLDLAECVAYMRERVPDAIVTNGAGNFSVWAHRFWRWHDYPHAARARRAARWATACRPRVAAKLLAPERTVICFAGDGDFLMSGQELATAMQYELPIVVLVVNNGMYGTIRMHQERHFPGRVVGTDLVNPDFAALRPRLRRARRDGRPRRRSSPARSIARSRPARPALLELRIDPEAITPRTTLSAIRADALRDS